MSNATTELVWKRWSIKNGIDDYCTYFTHRKTCNTKSTLTIFSQNANILDRKRTSRELWMTKLQEFRILSSFTVILKDVSTSNYVLPLSVGQK